VRNEAGLRCTPVAQLNPYQNRWTIMARCTNKSEVRAPAAFAACVPLPSHSLRVSNQKARCQSPASRPRIEHLSPSRASDAA